MEALKQNDAQWADNKVILISSEHNALFKLCENIVHLN